MNGETASLYNLSDCQEPVEIATVEEETELTGKEQCKKKGKKKKNSTRQEK